MDLLTPEEPPQWLENTAIGVFRVWHIIFLGCGGFLGVIIMFCCCIRIRIPRTRQEIEADYQRRKIARKFRQKLAKIKNSEMDDMDLKRALEVVRQEFIEESIESHKYGEDKKLLENEIKSHINASLLNLAKV